MENLIYDLPELSKSLDKFRENDEASLDIFTMRLEREWEIRLERVCDFYGFDKFEFEREWKVELILLQDLLHWYLDQEEYERCTRIHSLLASLQKKIII